MHCFYLWRCTMYSFIQEMGELSIEVSLRKVGRVIIHIVTRWLMDLDGVPDPQHPGEASQCGVVVIYPHFHNEGNLESYLGAVRFLIGYWDKGSIDTVDLFKSPPPLMRSPGSGSGARVGAWDTTILQILRATVLEGVPPLSFRNGAKWRGNWHD